jgi:hypothetical protein
MEAQACQLDHLVVTSPTLAAGVDWVHASLGVTPQAGGDHERMGTHNALLRLGNATYLEVIASDPGAPTPGRARWYELDRMAPDATPGLATWVARTDDIKSTVADCPTRYGVIEPMSRGSLNWLITIPPDGSLPGDGVVPTLIEWKTQQHPAARLDEQGCALRLLELFHPVPSSLHALLKCLGLHDAAAIHATRPGERPYLVAHIETPRGLQSISGRPT